MSFYNACMRYSSMILFWGAVAVFLLGFFSSLLSRLALASAYMPDSGAIMTSVNVINAFYTGFSSAFIPFFGAALLWLVDAKFPDQGGEAAE